jgi:hypothetical protein
VYINNCKNAGCSLAAIFEGIATYTTDLFELTGLSEVKAIRCDTNSKKFDVLREAIPKRLRQVIVSTIDS